MYISKITIFYFYRFSNSAADFSRIFATKPGIKVCDKCHSQDIRNFVKLEDPLEANINTIYEALEPIDRKLKAIQSIIVKELVHIIKSFFIFKTYYNILIIYFLYYFSSSDFVVEKPKSDGSYTGKRAKENSNSSYYEENEIKISVILDNVPDHYHVPGVTQIITE